MRPLTRLIALVPALAAVCLGCQPAPPNYSVAPPRAADKEGGDSASAFRGSLTCSNRGCHNSLDQSQAGTAPLSCSFSLWNEYDPHADAWAVLHDAGLKKGKGPHMDSLLYPGVKGGQVWKDPRCLACHVTPQATFAPRDYSKLASPKDPNVPAEWKFGVGCESCHGAADKWLAPHYEDKWKSNKVAGAKKEELGFNDLSDLRKRALVCAGCHVGAPADAGKSTPLRDMNHDHVAAGHPRLMFENASFLANLPKHWIEKDQSKEFYARAWLAGQAAAAEASLRLTADRAANAGKDDLGRPWPELTEYDCYACHNGLGGASWRTGLASTKGGSPGRPRPSRWYTGLLEPLGIYPKNAPMLTTLEAALRRPSKAGEVAEMATSVAKKLASAPLDADAAKLRAALVKHGQRPGDPASWQLTWDECEQIVLGLVALDVARDGKPSDDVKKLLGLLKFGPANDGPVGFRRVEPGGGRRPFDEEWSTLFGRLK